MTKTSMRIALAGLALIVGGALAGCGLGTSMTQALSPTTPQAASGLHGKAKGGEQPIAGAQVYLLMAGTSGYGSAATSLLTSSTTGASEDGSGNYYVTTDQYGNFNIDSYNTTACSGFDTADLTYIVLSGGNPGNNSANAQAVLLAALSSCYGLQHGAVSFVWANEVTTTAAAYALSSFIGADVFHVGSSSTNTTGLAGAFTAAGNLANIATGSPGGSSLPAGATVSSDSLNLIADILTYCVNSSGGTAGDSSHCGNLLGTTGSSANIAMAAAYMAQHPAANVSTLYGYMPAQPPFATALTGQPNDLTLAIKYTGGGMSAPKSPVVDAAGNLWAVSSGNSTVVEYSSAGAVLNTSATLGSQPNALAVDASGNVWVVAGTSAGNSELYELSSSASVLNTFNPGSQLNIPTSISIDASGILWIGNSGNNSLSAIYSSGGNIGTSYGSSPFTGITSPVGVSVSPH